MNNRPRPSAERLVELNKRANKILDMKTDNDDASLIFSQELCGLVKEVINEQDQNKEVCDAAEVFIACSEQRDDVSDLIDQIPDAIATLNGNEISANNKPDDPKAWSACKKLAVAGAIFFGAALAIAGGLAMATGFGAPIGAFLTGLGAGILKAVGGSMLIAGVTAGVGSTVAIGGMIGAMSRFFVSTPAPSPSPAELDLADKGRELLAGLSK